METMRATDGSQRSAAWLARSDTRTTMAATATCAPSVALAIADAFEAGISHI
jgi:hypothetical protein